MKNFYLLIAVSMFCCFSYSQEKSAISTANPDARIVEVFGNQMPTIMSDQDRYRSLTGILSRYEFVTDVEQPGEKHPKLSSIPLFNKYNPALQRDKVIDPSRFNILKYDLPFFTQRIMVYRIDGTDLLLVIHPQNLPR